MGLYLFYLSSVFFIRTEERSEINVCVQPAMFKWKTRLLTFLLYSINSEWCLKTSQKGGRKGGGKGGMKLFNPFSFALSITELVHRNTGVWYQILFPSDMLYL